jgi:predicted MPP superfamily phosphohydrolase
MLHIIAGIGIITLALLWFIGMNVLALVLYIKDKRRAQHGGRRIPEKTLILLTLAGGGIGAALGMYIMRHKTRKTKFRVSAALGLVVCAVFLIHAVHALTLDRIVVFREVAFESHRWPSELSGYRIAFMSDFHTISYEEMSEVVSELNTMDIDLLLLGGDFSMHEANYRYTLRALGRAETTDGIFGVEGNHDAPHGAFAAMLYNGITPLINSGLHIREGFYLGGVEDLWLGQPDVHAAIGGANPHDFVLLLTHNPDVAMWPESAYADLVLAGHTHGGQITFFGWPMYLLRGSISAHRTRFARNWAYGAENVPVFVTTGVGTYYTIPRVMARPEVVIFTLN